MSDKVYTKNLLGMEDLVTTETSTQTRNGSSVTVKGVVAANIDCKDSKSILEYMEFLEGRIENLENGVAMSNALVTDLKAMEDITAGDPLAITGYNSGLDVIEINVAGAGDVVFAVATESGVAGDMITSINTGLMEAFDTSMYSQTDILYWDIASGAIVTSEPSGIHQAIGYILKVNADNGSAWFELSAPRLPIGV